MYPLVTVITPSTIHRDAFNEQIKKMFALQDYPNKEHLFDLSPGNIGEKRNGLCEHAKGEIIIHFDSDDEYSPDWISRSVEALMKSGKDIAGLARALFYDKSANKFWFYTYPPGQGLHGATLCYYKKFWEQNKFMNMQVGEDSQFIRGKDYAAHRYTAGFTATIHEGNTSPRNISGERWEEY